MLSVTTKIEAVNIVLSAVGDAPVDTLDENDNVDVANILRIMDGVSRSVQAKGWDFNTYKEYTLKPDAYTKKINYNPNFIYWKATDGNSYVKRGDYIFDMTNNTDTFENDIILKVILAVEFEDLPTVFKDFIVAQTAIKFQVRYLGDEAVSQDLQMSAQEAYQALVEYDMNMGNYNMLQLPGVAENLMRS